MRDTTRHHALEILEKKTKLLSCILAFHNDFAVVIAILLFTTSPSLFEFFFSSRFFGYG